METFNSRRHFSRNVLFRMLVLGLLAAGLVAWNLDFINDFYFKNQLTRTGLIINGTILVLFALGVLRMLFSFLSYMREEAALARFVKNITTRRESLLKGVGDGTLIARRYKSMQSLHETRTPINQSALASTLVAAESTRTSLPKFINNILILTGVFGTIVSLSIALLGATDLLEGSVDTGGMGMVVHGMSTALSTTITAIVCYLYFGYFYLKLSDAQTNLISGIEEATTQYLMPRFQVQTDSVLYEFTGLIRSLQGLVDQMQDSQRAFAGVQGEMAASMDRFREDQIKVRDDLDTIVHILRIGFRLRDNE